jgi:hypothetical protein
MRPLFSARNRAASLIEMVIATSIMAIVAMLGFTVLVQGARYLRLNEMAVEAQKSGLLLMSKVHAELQSSDQAHFRIDPDGIVFPSPFKADGGTEYDPTTHKILLQSWVCYHYDSQRQTVTRRQLAIHPASATPAAAPPVSSFAPSSADHRIADRVGVFRLTQVTATPPLWQLDMTMGSMTDASGYGVELQTKVSPRN